MILICIVGLLAIICQLTGNGCSLARGNEKQTEACKSQNAQTGEIEVIRKVAERNGVAYGTSDFYLLLAIRRAENGGAGKQFGILSKTARTLDAQAANCACTIIKQHRRSGLVKVDDAYIRSLAARYCPVGASNDNGTNQFWIKNVTCCYKKLQET
jgi:hypothetical protein